MWAHPNPRRRPGRRAAPGGRLLLIAWWVIGLAQGAAAQAPIESERAPSGDAETLYQQMESAYLELDRLRAEIVHTVPPEVEQLLIEAEEFAIYVRVKRRGGEPLSTDELGAAIEAIERAQAALRGESEAASLSGIEGRLGRAEPEPAAGSELDREPVGGEAIATPGELIVPYGTRFLIRLRSQIQSASALSGDPFTAVTVDPVTIGDVLAIPSATLVVGHIAEVSKPGRVQGRGRVVLAFDHIYPYDRKLPLVASFSRGDPEQKNVAESESGVADDVREVVVQAAIPAAIGAIFGGASGAARGAAVGATIGTAVVLATPGLDVLLPEGSLLWIQLEEDLRF